MVWPALNQVMHRAGSSAAVPQTRCPQQQEQSPTAGAGSHRHMDFPGPNLLALPQPLSRRVPCHPAGLSAQRRGRGVRQPRSIFRPWRIPLGSPFRAEKVSHGEGEAKTRIRPTDPALTRVHRSELAGLRRLGGREVAAGAREETAKERPPGASPSATRRPGAGAHTGITRRAWPWDAPWMNLPR